MPFIPVQWKIDPNIRSHFGKDKNGNEYKYLLQVWNKEGKKVIEDLPLVTKVIKWCICHEYFIMRTEKPDPDSEYFQITNLETKAVTLINDFLKGDDSFEHFAFNDDRLFAASENTIKIASVKLHHRDGKRILRKVREADVSEIVMVANEADYRKHTNGEKASMHRIHGLATPMGGLAKIE